jgi:hypothetical protein
MSSGKGEITETYKRTLECQQTICPPGYTSAFLCRPTSNPHGKNILQGSHMLSFCSGVHIDRCQCWEAHHSLCIYMLGPCQTTLLQGHKREPTDINCDWMTSCPVKSIESRHRRMWSEKLIKKWDDIPYTSLIYVFSVYPTVDHSLCLTSRGTYSLVTLWLFLCVNITVCYSKNLLKVE